MPEITIDWPKWEELANPSFVPYVYNQSRYLVFVGGRGSSKSFFVKDIVIYRMLSHTYFRGLLIRQVSKSIRGSMFQALKDRIWELGLQSLFTIRESLLEIECANGNKVIAAGLDDATKIKSVAEVTFAWYEEDIPLEGDFITVTTSIRTKKGEFLQEIFTVNPEVNGDYQDNWFYKLFFKDRPNTYEGVTTVDIGDEDVELTYSTHHSTHHDNPHLPKEFRAYLENLKHTNPYYYEIYTLGNWGNRITGSQAYKGFDRSKHVRKLDYNPSDALHISFDFNVNPYMTLAIWQIEGTLIKQIDEITAKDPDNNTAATCRIFASKYPNHIGGLFIYGDPSGVSEDTRSEKGHNDFSIIMKELNQYNPTRRLHKKAPAVVTRIQWINSILAIQEGGLKIVIDEGCKTTITDYQNGKEASDGTKFKEKVKDPNTKISYELYHHVTDANDYFLTKAFSNEFRKYSKGGRVTQAETFKTDRSDRFAYY